VEAALIKAISAIHRTDSLDGFEHAFLSHVATTIEADAFGLYLLDAKRRAPEKIFATGAPRVFLEEYESYRNLDPIYDFVVRQRSVADGANLLGARDWQSHPLHRWLQHWGLGHSLQGPLVINGEVAGTLNFARRASSKPFTARSRWLAQVVCDEAGAALQRLMQNQKTATELELLSSCFENVPMPLVITDFRGQVRALNRRARSEASSGAAQQADPLCRIMHIVSELASSAKQTLEVRTDGGDTYMSTRLGGCENLFLSAWTEKTAQAQSVLDSLPRRSREVAELLIQGKQNKWIAWKLGISRHTIKYHVRRVYSMLGVNSRLELLRLATGRPRK
jgi:DNA-binding CsgD family transcriptional regulator